MYNDSVEVNEIFSNNLSRMRKLQGYSQRELAKISGISHRMINHYENNPTSVPMNKIKILADALNTRIAVFFDDIEDDNSFETLDVRWIKKINEIRELPETDRKEINRHISSLVEKHRLKEIHKAE